MGLNINRLYYQHLGLLLAMLTTSISIFCSDVCVYACRLYAMDLEDPAEIDWEQVSECVG